MTAKPRQTARRPRHAPKPVPVGRAEFDLWKLGVSRFDLRDPYHLAISLSWPRFVIAMIAWWLAINLIFAALYVLSPGDVANAAPGSFSDVFFFSVETLATVGYGVMAPATLYGHIISAMEIVTGTAFTAIVTGLLFVRFSRPKAKIVYAEDAVITPHNGKPTLMLRLANGRTTLMTGVNARLFMLVAEHTDEGKLFRRVQDLKLIQSHMPVFIMPWTLMHPIDEDSPLAGADGDKLAKWDARIFLTVQGRDEALSAPVQDIKDYPASHIHFGMRFADSVIQDDTGRVTADLTRIGLLEPDAPG